MNVMPLGASLQRAAGAQSRHGLGCDLLDLFLCQALPNAYRAADLWKSSPGRTSNAGDITPSGRNNPRAKPFSKPGQHRGHELDLGHASSPLS